MYPSSTAVPCVAVCSCIVGSQRPQAFRLHYCCTVRIIPVYWRYPKLQLWSVIACSRLQACACGEMVASYHHAHRSIEKPITAEHCLTQHLSYRPVLSMPLNSRLIQDHHNQLAHACAYAGHTKAQAGHEGISDSSTHKLFSLAKRNLISLQQ